MKFDLLQRKDKSVMETVAFSSGATVANVNTTSSCKHFVFLYCLISKISTDPLFVKKEPKKQSC